MSTLVINGNGFSFQVRSKKDKTPKVSVLTSKGVNSVKAAAESNIRHAA